MTRDCADHCDSPRLWDALGLGRADAAPVWQDGALCAQADPDLWFPGRGESSAPAKRVCAGCAVRVECLEYALSHGERFGVWGGVSERQRRRLEHARVSSERGGGRDRRGRGVPVAAGRSRSPSSCCGVAALTSTRRSPTPSRKR